jgi:phosphomannomutase
MSELIDRARSWIADDPDPASRAELEAIIDDDDLDELASRMDTVLEFGTAGIRGQVAPARGG